MPDIYGYSLRRSFGIQSFVDLGIIDEFTTSSTEITFGNGAAADDPGLNAQLETTSNLTVAHNFTGASTVRTEGRLCSQAGFAYTLAITAGTVNLAIHAVGTGNRLAFVGRISIYRIGNGYTLLANTVKHVGDLFID